MSDKKKKKNERPLYLDMPFGEALEKFIGVNPDDIPKKRAAKPKPRGPTGAKDIFLAGKGADKNDEKG